MLKLNQSSVSSTTSPVIGALTRCLEPVVHGTLRPAMAQAVSVANQLKLKRFAADIPTGLDPVLGQPHNPVFQADYCATFVDLKTCFQNPQAADCLGKVSVIDIGFTPESCNWKSTIWLGEFYACTFG